MTSRYIDNHGRGPPVGRYAFWGFGFPWTLVRVREVMATASGGSRETFSGRLGFTLAAIGSAVGLGNMWRFSYMAAENGGAAFVLLYILMTLLVGLPVMLAEMTLGRGARSSPIRALALFGGSGWAPLGVLFVTAGVIILAYYGVIAGWTARYAFEGVAYGFRDPSEANDHFNEIATGSTAAFWQVGIMFVTAAIVFGGIRGGIERVSTVLMPVLAFLIIGLAIYAGTLSGAGEGYAYYFQTDFQSVLKREVLQDAAGQAFFSLSLGMGAILTYSSYLSRNHHLPNESLVIAVSDFGVAFMAGMVVFPILFAFGLQDQVSGSTLGTLFITLPSAFASMGGPGRVVGALFFVALLVGAITSTISLLEVVVSSLIDTLKMNRKVAVTISAFVITAVGIPAAFDLNVLELMDQIGGNVVLIFGGLMLSIFVGWIMTDPIGEVSAGTSGIKWFFLWRTLLRFVVPAILAFVLYFLLIDTYAMIDKLVNPPAPGT